MSHPRTAPQQHSPEAIRAAREAAGYTREAAAFLAGVSVAAVQDAERGRDSRGSTLSALARLYEVSIDSLFIHEPEADKPSTADGTTHGDRTAGKQSPVPAHNGR